MAEECPMLANCGFFKKYGASRELACVGFIQTYCRGDKKEQCRRKDFRKEFGSAPPDDMLPNGRILPPNSSGA